MQTAGGPDARPNDRENAGKTEQPQSPQALQRESTQLRHALDNEKFERIKMQSALLQSRAEVANQSRELEKWIRTSFECNRELEKSSCMVAALCGEHERNIYLNDQLTHCRGELNQSHQHVASLQDRLAGLHAELERSRSFQIEAEALREQFSIQTRELEQTLAHNQELQSVRVENIELNKQLSISTLESDALRTRYNTILASNSWSIARPFRVFRRALTACMRALVGR